MNKNEVPETINVNLDPREIFELICPKCQEKVKAYAREKIKPVILDGLLENMVDQALGNTFESKDGKSTAGPKRMLAPKRVLPSVREQPAK